MAGTGDKIILYTSQTQTVLDRLRLDGTCFSQREYVAKKYQESGPIFLAVYDWFVQEAQNYLPRPSGAEFPYWAFRDLYSLEGSDDSGIIKLEVPRSEVLFFDKYDWIKLLRLQYLGQTPEEEQCFRQQLIDRGVRREADVMLTNFYPDLKRQIQESWKRLFRHHEKIKSGDPDGVTSIQAGLWQLRQEWIVSR